ncbi:hypothetical protein Nepgr_025557 [Nepenthes gracilis]|uniref:BTB/POZ domain-containing protein NPY2 n=1 Tax=Nepenthes gracilis TaxID=150966 RepID=A0AAD3Y169_NEPGR|nr:hypothetical protein Nepgr_025557 [Nepenthes gracilis]
MKFMKLGSKPDTFQSNGNNIRYIASELSTDITVNVGDVKFNLHKYPLLSKSSHLRKLVADTTEENGDEIYIDDIPGGHSGFEICAKFCYGICVTLNAHNVVTARCAAEYLGMHEAIEKGNLVYKIDVFLNSSIFRSWKDSIISLQTTKYMLPWSEELNLVGHFIHSIASKASIDSSKVDWSYKYNQKKIPEETGNYRVVPKDWWVEDLCELDVDLYEQVISSIKGKGMVSNEVIGDSLTAYASQKLPIPNKGQIPSTAIGEHRSTISTILRLLPTEKGCVSCSFLLKLLKAAILVESGETAKRELVKKIGQQLEEATVNDLLIWAPEEETMTYDVNTVEKIIQEFLTRDENPENGPADIDESSREISLGILSEASKLMVANLIDAYLGEIAKDQNLLVSKFVELAEMVCGISRPAHDGLYRAIDIYLKEHPGISKAERKRICRLMDCKKLSPKACMHAVQNERLPIRVIVQLLFFEQVRAASKSGTSTPKSINDLNCGSSRSMTNTDEDWDATATAEELRALKSELAALRLDGGKGGGNGRNADLRSCADKPTAIAKMKGMLISKKVFARIWSGKNGNGEMSGSDSSESHNSINQHDVRSPSSSRNRVSIS